MQLKGRRKCNYFMIGILGWSLLACEKKAMDISSAKLIDLTHSFEEATVYWPTEEGFILEKEFEGMTEKGYYYAANKFRSAEHGGTHLDAPVHFAQGKQTVDQIPLENLVGNGVLIDVSSKAAADRDYQVSVQDLLDWEKVQGEIPVQSILLIRTGFGKSWPDRQKYLGTAERGPEAVASLHFPGLHPDAAKWLLQNRRIKAVGIDTASIDYGQSTQFETHRALFEKNVPALENLAELEHLSFKGFTVIALPMKIKGGSGAPLRIMAVLEPRPSLP